MGTRIRSSLPIATAWLALLTLLVGCERPASTAHATAVRAPSYGAQFSAHWHDGKAELAGYRLTYPRYGQLRQGTAVAIFVTEPFTKADIKPEDPARADFAVIKLNLVQDFQTGVYDYNLMTSAFVATAKVGDRPPGSVRKVSFSSQEWCGHVYAQARLGGPKTLLSSHSYFEGEGDQQWSLPRPPDGLSEDALLLWARGLAGPALEPGERVEVPLLDSLELARLRHRPVAWGRAELSRGSATQPFAGPAGSMNVRKLDAAITRDDGSQSRWSFLVEDAAPHRIARITRDDGYEATLTGAARMPYWQLHDNGHERYLQQLGLHAPQPAAATGGAPTR